jgi:spermidine synthase
LSSKQGQGTTGIYWIVTIYFCSGLCSLIDEVVWVRLLKLTLGNTVHASSVVVSMFMGGLALGALVMSRFADRVRRRLRLYALLEVCATLSALAIPFVLKAADAVYRWFYLKYQPGQTVLTIVQVIVSACILLLPAMVMGSTLPLLGRHLTSLRERVGNLVGRLYALNTLGAALGCFLAGFVLIRLVGVMGTLYVAAAINLLVAAAGWMLSRRHDTVEQPAAPEAAAAEPEAARSALPYVLLAAVCCSGLVSIAYEIIWMRSIVFMLGSYTFVFSSVLTVYLVGNVLGVAIGSWLSSRVRNPAAAFGVSLGCLGICGLLYMPLFSLWLEAPQGLLNLSSAPGEATSTAMHVLLKLWHCTVLFLLPSILMGVGFPLALQAWCRYRLRVGQTTGVVYGVNTIGAVLGGLLAGFLLIPLLGVQLAMTSLGLLAAALALLLVQLFSPSLRPLGRAAYSAAAALVLMAAIVLPGDIFLTDIVGQAGDAMNVRILAVREGPTATVSVQQDMSGRLELTSGRIAVGSDGELRSAQTTLGHLGILLNSRAKDLLSIGFGSGETTACMAAHGPRKIDCVEISPELVELAVEHFSHINLGDRLHDRVNMIYMDGKNYLHLTPEKYDVIVSGADLPNYSGSAPLFAIDHYRNGLRRLNAGGLFMTKLHIWGVSDESFDSLLGSFIEVFPHATLWFPTTRPLSFFYMIGSAEEQLYSPKYIEAELMRTTVRNSVRYLEWSTNFDLFTGYIGDKDDIARYLESYQPNSDDRPFVEFNLEPQQRGMRDFFTRFISQVRSDSLLEHIDWSEMSVAEKEDWLSIYRIYDQVAAYVLESHGVSDLLGQLVNAAEGDRLLHRYAPLVAQEESALSQIRTLLNRPDAGPDKVLAQMESLLQRKPGIATAWMVKSWALRDKNDADGALRAAARAAVLSPRHPQVQGNLGELLFALGMLDEAVEHYRQILPLIPEDAGLRYNLAAVLRSRGEMWEAISSLEEAMRLRPDWSRPAKDLAWILAVYKDAPFHNPGRAVRLAERARRLSRLPDARILDTLAIAYAAAGRMEKAIETGNEALVLAERSGRKETLAAIQGHLQLFGEGRAYFE